MVRAKETAFVKRKVEGKIPMKQKNTLNHAM
jgi:hypothetical protein